MSGKLKKAAGKKDKGKKAGGGTGGSTRHLMPHEILDAMGSPRDAAKGMTRPRAATAGMQAAVKLSKQRSKELSSGGGMGGGGMGGGGMAGGMLPAMSAMGYGPRVVSKTLPIDPNDTSSFAINIPQVLHAILTILYSLYTDHTHCQLTFTCCTPTLPTHTPRRVPRPSSTLYP